MYIAARFTLQRQILDISLKIPPKLSKKRLEDRHLWPSGSCFRTEPPIVATVISLKKYLDMVPGKEPEPPSPAQSGLNELCAAVIDAYRSALVAMGKSGALACPAVGSDLQQAVDGIHKSLSSNLTAVLIDKTKTQTEDCLLQWGARTAEYFKARTGEVKELLIVLARTAASIGEHDQRYASQVAKFTTQLQTIADLEDLSQVRLSLVQCATELKTYVDQMRKESQESVAQLQAEVTTYSTKLKAVEQVASQDSLTGLASRRKVEERIEGRIERRSAFCVAILDLERFKQVNDTYGHPVGDDLLQQFSQELKSNSRANDIVGRWGGDEFIIIFDCDLDAAKTQLERVQKWVLGEYTVKAGGPKTIKLKVDASIGVAQWKSGQSLNDLIASADAAMYREKGQGRGQGA
jgi:diguanylate cyclase (GGDEF)-like protein